jgi:hypothetical protein
MTGLNDRMAKLESGGAAVTNLNERIAKLEARPEPAPPGPATVPAPAAPAANPDADAAVQALKDQVAKLADDTAAATARAAKLELQIASAGDQGRGDRALLLALANLRIAMSGSAPYAAELSTVQAVAGDRADVKEMLSALSEGAASGMPSVPSLATRFDRDVAPAILRAATRTESEDWGDQILSRLKRLVVVRRIRPGAAGGDSTQDAVARAEAALRAGDLTGAIAALGNLTGPAATAAAPWLASAKQRLAAESAVTKLWQAEAARVAAASSAGSKP